MLKFQDFIKASKVHTDVSDFVIGVVFMQKGQLIVFESEFFCGTQLQWPIHVCCLKICQHCLGTHKTKIFANNVSLKYFETQPKALVKQLKEHYTLVLLDVELIHKPRRDNIILDALSRRNLKWKNP